MGHNDRPDSKIGKTGVSYVTVASTVHFLLFVSMNQSYLSVVARKIGRNHRERGKHSDNRKECFLPTRLLLV